MKLFVMCWSHEFKVDVLQLTLNVFCCAIVAYFAAFVKRGLKYKILEWNVLSCVEYFSH